MNLAQHLRRGGATIRTVRRSVTARGCCYDYAALAGRVARLASRAARRVSVLRPATASRSSPTNTPEYLEALYAIWHAGCVGVPVNAKLHPAELNYILDHSGARVCFASSDLATAIEAHAPRYARTHRGVRQRAPIDRLLAADACDVDAARA